MKYIIILGDGMADHPIKALNNKTPLMVADIQNIDYLCEKGRCGRLVTVPDDMPPGSEVANLAVLGYDVYKVYQGRGVLEAASMGVQLDKEDLAMRCNLICIEDGKIKNHSAGHIETEEATILIHDLNKELGKNGFKLFPGISYRHLAVLKNGLNGIQCTPPHDVPGTDFNTVMVKALSTESEKTASYLNEIIKKSQRILMDHPINKKRIRTGKDPANSVWFWSSGNKPEMKTMKELYGVSGAVISAVDIIKGLGIYAGMEVIRVEGATGLNDTNYEGKAEAAINALETSDFVYVHVEAPDEAGHEGNYQLKINTLENLDKRLVKQIIDKAALLDEEVAIAVIPDHATPCEVRTHTRDAVPFVIYHPGEEPDSVREYNEISTEKGAYGLLKGDQFIKKFLKV